MDPVVSKEKQISTLGSTGASSSRQAGNLKIPSSKLADASQAEASSNSAGIGSKSPMGTGAGKAGTGTGIGAGATTGAGTTIGAARTAITGGAGTARRIGTTVLGFGFSLFATLEFWGLLTFLLLLPLGVFEFFFPLLFLIPEDDFLGAGTGETVMGV